MLAPYSSAYLRRENRAAAFLPGDYRDAATRRRLADALSARPAPVSAAVWQELAAQQAALPPSAARQQNLAALAQPGTLAVVSGQQLGLYLGPLYTFYKAATAIQLAASLSAELSRPCVPIFWLQSEDHDFDEIRTCHLPIFDGEHDTQGLTLALPEDRTEAAERGRVSVAHRQLGPEQSELMQALRDALGGLPYAAQALPLLAEHYRQGGSLLQAFAGLVAALFADEGLLVLSPRSPALIRAAGPIYRAAIEEAPRLSAALAARGQALSTAGFSEQVAVRPGSSLFFFHTAAHGPRYRLDYQPTRQAWLLPSGVSSDQAPLSSQDLLGLLATDPLRFSTSALLRPCVQDYLLPTVAYVAGPGEINYWAQLQPVYDALSQRLPLQQPLLVPRARFRITDESSRALLAKLKLSPADVERPREAALQRALAARDPDLQAAAPAPPELRRSLLADLSQQLTQLAEREPGLVDAVRRTQVSVERNLDRLLQRYQRLSYERDQVLCQRIDRLQRLLYPQAGPQERHFGLPYFLCRYGLPALKGAIFASLRERDLSHTDVRSLEL